MTTRREIADILQIFDRVTNDTRRVIETIDDSAAPVDSGRRELRRRIVKFRTQAQELMDWVAGEGGVTP